MRPIDIVYEEPAASENRETYQSLAELKSRLHSISDTVSSRLKTPFGIDLEIENGDRLSVVLAEPRSFLSRYSAAKDATVTAIGDPTAVGKTNFYFGDYSFVPNKFWIPTDVAWKVIEEWCESGELSSLVQWTSKIR